MPFDRTSTDIDPLQWALGPVELFVLVVLAFGVAFPSVEPWKPSSGLGLMLVSAHEGFGSLLANLPFLFRFPLALCVLLGLLPL